MRDETVQQQLIDVRGKIIKQLEGICELQRLDCERLRHPLHPQNPTDSKGARRRTTQHHSAHVSR